MTQTTRTHKTIIKATTKLQWFANKVNNNASNAVLEAVANISQSPDFYAPQCEIWGDGVDEILPIDFVNRQTLAVEAGLLKVVPFGVKDLYLLCRFAELDGKINASLVSEIKRLCEVAGWEFDGAGKNTRLFAVVADEGILYATKSGTITYYDFEKFNK